MTTLVFLILSIIILSAVFSMTEAAIFSISFGKVEALKEKEVTGSKSLSIVKNKISRPIITIVILNNIVNIVGSIFVGFYAAKILGDSFLGIISAILTVLIILFAEIIPKTIGERYHEKISLFVAGPLLFISKIFTPISWLIEVFTDKFSTVRKTTSEEELRILSQIGHKEGYIEQDEKEIIEKVFLMNDHTAKDIMTPRMAVEALDKNKPLSKTTDILGNAPYSRYPVYKDNIDNIVGFVSTVKLLQAITRGESNKNIEDFMSTILSVTEHIKVDQLLVIFQKSKSHMAVVKDEFGGTSGVVTLEDVLEQLVGEIMDETDEVASLRQHIKDKHRKQ